MLRCYLVPPFIVFSHIFLQLCFKFSGESVTKPFIAAIHFGSGVKTVKMLYCSQLNHFCTDGVLN